MKILKTIKKIMLVTFAIIFFAFAIFMTVLLLNRNKYGITKIDNISMVPINARISSEKYKKGDLVFVKDRDVTSLKVSEEVFVYHVEKGGSVNIDLGIIGAIHEEEKAIEFKNGDTYSMEFVIGGAEKIYNDYGTYYSIIQSKWGFLFMILVPSFLIFIYELYALIVEIKYGKDEFVA